MKQIKKTDRIFLHFLCLNLIAHISGLCIKRITWQIILVLLFKSSSIFNKDSIIIGRDFKAIAHMKKIKRN